MRLSLVFFQAAGLARHIDKTFRALRELTGLVNDGRTDISFIFPASLLDVLAHALRIPGLQRHSQILKQELRAFKGFKWVDAITEH